LFALVVRVQFLQLPCDLLGRPALAQVVANDFEQRSITAKLGLGAGKASAPVAALLGELGVVALAARIALALSADGAFAAPQGTGYGAEALLLLQSKGYRMTFALAQLLVILI
jgi:hypothetical protein